MHGFYYSAILSECIKLTVFYVKHYKLPKEKAVCGIAAELELNPLKSTAVDCVERPKENWLAAVAAGARFSDSTSSSPLKYSSMIWTAFSYTSKCSCS
mmetsp:Transcript_322/g.299  ORF Transcript_322/g.299 Transcript_322/m.299 type:complete len:98 (-) Transcript_322:1451-1744(-)